jgi:hypothetical protein
MAENPEVQQNTGIVPPFHHKPQMQSQHQQLLAQQQEQKLKQFWEEIRREMEELRDLKNHQLPLARIKKIMKSDEDVKVITSNFFYENLFCSVKEYQNLKV